MIDLIDPYESLYKITGESYEMRAVRKRDLMAVDYLIKVVGLREDVKTIDDWGALAKCFEFYTRQWPQDWSEFAQYIKDVRETRARKDGYSREKGEEGVRYVGAIPHRLMKVIKIIFPKQQWDREFTEKFINNIKIFRVGEKTDTWFTLPNAPAKRESLEDMIKKIDNKANGSTKPKRSKRRA